MGKKHDFTIQRGSRMERTVVGIDGQTHVYANVVKQGKNGHYTDEGKYRQAIKQAVKKNTSA